MSSLTGIAQFTNRFAQNIMGYEQDKKNEAERVADKQRELARQEQQDKNTQQSHDLTQKKGNILLEDAELTLNQNKSANDDFNSNNIYQQTGNQIKHLKSIGAPEQQSVDVLSKAINSNKNLPYTIEFERDVTTGQIIQRQDENGKPFYFQSVIDKETGKEMGRKATTLDEAMNSYTQLQRGGAIEAEVAAAQAARLAKEQDIQDKLTLKAGEAQIDHTKHAADKQVDHNYAMEKLGVENVFELEKLAVQHGYKLTELDRQTTNRIAQSVATSDINSGGTPIVGGGGNDGSVAGIIQSLTGSESGGVAGANRTNTDGRSFGGLLQMGDARLTDYARATGTKPITAMQFKNLSASQQQAVNNWHIQDLTKAAQATGAVGSVINGVPVTIGGLVAVAHLGGKGGMNKFVQTNGKYNPKDELGTSLTDYLVKHASGGVQVQRSVPGVPKTTGSKTSGNSGNSATTPQNFNASIDKGVDTALKGIENYGLKAGPATTASFARAGRKLKDMGVAKNNAEFLSLYQDAFDLVIGAIPESELKGMSKADKNELGHKVLLSMAGASSLGNLKDIIYRVNPAARGGGQKAASPMLPGQQPKAVISTPQVGKLQALYSRGLPAVKTDPKTTENKKALENLSLNMDW